MDSKGTVSMAAPAGPGVEGACSPGQKIDAEAPPKAASTSPRHPIVSNFRGFVGFIGYGYGFPIQRLPKP